MTDGLVPPMRLGRLTPRGVQEPYKLHIGGIDQWVYVRGRDLDHSIVLFVLGGPRSRARRWSVSFAT